MCRTRGEAKEAVMLVFIINPCIGDANPFLFAQRHPTSDHMHGATLYLTRSFSDTTRTLFSSRISSGARARTRDLVEIVEQQIKGIDYISW